MINNTTGFSNSQPVTNGQLRFLNRQVFKVGADLSHKFQETIKLQDGTPLQLSPDDYVLQFRLIKGSQNGQPIQQVELPAPLLTQARQGDKIFFSQNNEKYELEISPCLSWWSSKLQTYSFDECIKGAVGQGCTAISMYLDKADIPTQKGHIRWGDVIELSPNAQRLEIGTRGCVPTNFNDLMASLKKVDQGVSKCGVVSQKENDRLILFIDQPGLHVESLNSVINVDLIVDSNRLYVHSYQKSIEEMSHEAKKTWKIEDDDEDEFIKEKLYWMNLEAGPIQIDKDAILATRLPGGRLQIELPYLKKQKQEMAAKESLFIEKETKTQNRKPIDFDSEISPQPEETEQNSVKELNENLLSNTSDEDFHIEEDTSSDDEKNNKGYCIVS